MKNERSNKLKRKGSQNLQSSSRAIEKRLIERNMQRIPAAPTYDYAPAASNIHHGTIQGESIACTDQSAGYIFMCNGKTKADCYKYRVFGLPSGRMYILEKIKPHMKLFLYDFDLKLLYGVYIAASAGKLAIEPAAFGGQFSAQVRFEILRDCIPLPESTFKPAISDNYKGGSKFRQELSNKQVADLISLFHPVAQPSREIVGSLMPNNVRSGTIIPRGSEMRPQTALELSYQYNQYLARSNSTNEVAASTIRHVQPELSLAHAPHALLANRDLLPPDLASLSQFGPFNSAEAYQAYENPVLHRRYSGMPYDTERVMLQQVEPRNKCYKQGQTAAYWVQLASGDQKGVYSSSPASIGIGSGSIGASDAVIAQACSAVQEINDRGTVQPSVPPGFGADSVSISLSETAPAAAHEISHTENIWQVDHAYNYNPGMLVSLANMPVQAHGQLLHQVPVEAHDQRLPQVPEQAHGQLLQQTPAHLNSSAHPLPSSASYWTGVSYQDPGQVYQYYAQMPSSENSAVYWTGVAHDPNQVYQYPHPPSSGNSAPYRAGVAYQDPRQAYHNVTFNDPSLQVQAYDPSYAAAASHMSLSTSHMPSST